MLHVTDCMLLMDADADAASERMVCDGCVKHCCVESEMVQLVKDCSNIYQQLKHRKWNTMRRERRRRSLCF